MWPARRAESVVRLQGEKVSSHVISSSIICPALACSPGPGYIQPVTRINGSTVRYLAVLRIQIQIHQIHVFLGLPDPDPLVRGMDPYPDPALDPDPSIIVQK